MRRWITVAVAVPLVLVAVWAGAWWWLGQRVAETIEGELAALAESGLQITHERRRTSGFPFSLQQQHDGITVTPRDGAWQLSLNSVRSGASLFAPRVVRSRIGPDGGGMARIGTLRIPAHGPGLAEIAIGADALVVDTPLQGDGPMLSFAAEALSLVETRRAAVLDAVLDLSDLAGRIDALRTASGVSGHRLRLSAAEAATAHAPVGPGLIRRVEATGRRIELEAMLAGLRGPSVAAALEAPGQFLVTLAAAETDVLDLTYAATRTALLADDPDVLVRGLDFSALPVTAAVRMRMGPNSQRVALADGHMEIGGDAAETTLDIALPLFAGGFEIGRAAVTFTMPLRPAPIPEPFALDLRLTDLRPDAETWALIDPDETLMRDPLSLIVDLGGEVAITGPLDSTDAFGRPPVSVQVLQIRRLDFAGFGAVGAAEGQLAPSAHGGGEGIITLGLQGWRGLLAAAARLGGLGPEQEAALAEMAQTLRHPGDPEALQAEFLFSRGGISLNGFRLR